MNCPRCEQPTQVVSEYYLYNEKALVRDTLCISCNSVTVETFYDNSNYKSDWIDLNV